jgi:hypothetical protein
MKNLISGVGVMSSFYLYGIAANSDAKLKRIEMLEGKINTLKVGCSNIHHIEKKQMKLKNQCFLFWI